MMETWAKKSAQNYAPADIVVSGFGFLRIRGAGPVSAAPETSPL